MPQLSWRTNAVSTMNNRRRAMVRNYTVLPKYVKLSRFHVGAGAA